MMRYFLLTISALVAASVSGTTLGETPRPEATPDPEKVVCKYTKVVDSKIPQRVCLTTFEWEDRQRAQLEGKRSSKNRNSYCSEPSGPC